MSPIQPSPTPTPLVSQTPDAPAPVGPVSDLINLSSGKELNELAAISLAASKATRIIVFAGPVDCGKTTLVTSLYELFQSGPVAGQMFSGSTTLPGFEQRCDLGRASSGGETPDTPRSPYKGPDPLYLHLRTCSTTSPKRYTDFLFTDVSGEMFEHANNSTAECLELKFIQRATDLVLLLDSEKAVLGDQRGMVHESRTLLQSFVDNKMLAPFCVVTIAWAKVDYFESASKEDAMAQTAFRQEVEAEFRARFQNYIPHPRLQFTEVAARPIFVPTWKYGHGVPEMLKGWIELCPRSREMKLNPENKGGDRESEMFGIRYFRDLAA